MFTPGRERYQQMMGTVGEYQRLCERENGAGRRVRSTGPVPFGGDLAVRAEWTRYEALVERTMGPYRFSGLCRYDTRTTPADVMDPILPAHQNVVTAAGVRRNDRHRTPTELLRALTPFDGPDPLEAAPVIWADPDCTAVAPARHGVHRALREAGVDADQAEGFVAAVGEVVATHSSTDSPPFGCACTVTGDGGCAWSPIAGSGSPIRGPASTHHCRPTHYRPAPVVAGTPTVRPADHQRQLR